MTSQEFIVYPPNSPHDPAASMTYSDANRALAGKQRRATEARLGSLTVEDRRLDRLVAAERSLHEAHRAVLAAGTDPDLADVVFAMARDSLAEARACRDMARRQLALADYE